MCLRGGFAVVFLHKNTIFTSLTVVYETTLSNLPPVSSEAVVVLTQPTAPLGAVLRHINIHHNTGTTL